MSGLLAAVVVGGVVVGLAGAQETNATSRLPDVVVTATRQEREAQSVAAATHRVEAESGLLDGGRTLPDLLEGIPSVMVQKTGYGQGSPFLRGFTGFRTLCLVDGIRLNNSVFREGPNQYWNTVDPYSLDACELVMGPSSVLYGSDAIGGVANAIPADVPDHSGQPTWERTLMYRGATADKSTTGRAQVGGRLREDVGFVGGYTIKDFGDLKGGRDVGRQRHTGYDEQDFDGRLMVAPSEDSRLVVGHQTVDQDDAWRTHRTIYGIDWEGLSRGDDKAHVFDQHRDLTYTRYTLATPDAVVDRTEVTLSRQLQTEDLVRTRKDDTGDEQGFDVETWGGALQLESGSPLGTWVYGTEYYRDGVDSYSRRMATDGSVSKVEIQGPVADDATYDTIGVYAQDTFALGRDLLDVTPGARYTHAAADADRVKDPRTGAATALKDDWDAVAGSLQVLHPLTEDRRHVVYASAAQGFRAPNLSDLTRLDTARSGELETPSPDLDPERYLAYEIGAKSRTARLTSQVAYYYTVIDGMIVRAPTGVMIDENMEVTKKNAGDGYVQGVEASETLRITDQWSLWALASWMDGEVDAYPQSADVQERDTISRLMPLTGQLGARWQTPAGRYWCEAVADAAEKADKLSADDKRDTQRIPPGGTPGYVVYTLRTGATLFDGLDTTLALENVTDEDYRIHGSGVNEPGRNLVLTAAYTF